MKKDLIFAPIMLVLGILLFLLRFTGMPVHIAVSVVGMFILAVYTAATKKEWKIPTLEIIMRAFYGIALIMGLIVMNLNIVALSIAHKASAALFVVLLVVLFVHKLIVNKKAKN